MHALTSFHYHACLKTPPLFREYQEWKANNFALQACVPTFMLNKIKLPINEEKAINKISLLFNVEYDFAQKGYTIILTIIFLQLYSS